MTDLRVTKEMAKKSLVMGEATRPTERVLKNIEPFLGLPTQ